MSERQKHTEFLRELMRSHECDPCRELQCRIIKAERDEHCMRSAVGLAFVLGLLAASGLGYSVVFLPEFFQNNTPMVVRLFSALLLASGICLLAFMALWCWYRSVSNALHNEGREFIVSRQKGHAPAPLATPLPETERLRAESLEAGFATVRGI